MYITRQATVPTLATFRLEDGIVLCCLSWMVNISILLKKFSKLQGPLLPRVMFTLFLDGDGTKLTPHKEVGSLTVHSLKIVDQIFTHLRRFFLFFLYSFLSLNLLQK